MGGNAACNGACQARSTNHGDRDNRFGAPASGLRKKAKQGRFYRRATAVEQCRKGASFKASRALLGGPGPAHFGGMPDAAILATSSIPVTACRRAGDCNGL